MNSDSGPSAQESLSFLSLGSNLGKREQNLCKALELLIRDGIEVPECSALYETEPVEVKAQPHFLNLVCRVDAGKVPHLLLRKCQSIENRLGRFRYQLRGPRLIDIDLLYFGNRKIESKDLTIPHPRISERRFVLVPLAEIAPQFVDPRKKKSIEQLLEECTDTSQVSYFAKPPILRKWSDGIIT